MKAMPAVMKQCETVTLENGWKVPVTVKDGIKYVKTREGDIECALSLDKQVNVPQVIGKLVGHGQVNVVRDTGCTGVIVKKDLCPASSFTGSCTMVDGSVKVAPIVVANLDTPFFKGKVRAMAMCSPIFDVIIGNIAGARDASNPDFMWKPEDEDEEVSGQADSSQKSEEESAEDLKSKETERLEEVDGCEEKSMTTGSHPDGELGKLRSIVSEGGDVGYKSSVDDVGSKEVQSDTVVSASTVTRSMSKARALKPLIVAQPDLVRVDRKQLIDLQRQDHSLDKVRTLVENPVVQSRRWQERYFFDGHVLYREDISVLRRPWIE